MKRTLALTLALGALVALALPDDAEARRGRGRGFHGPRVGFVTVYRVPYYGSIGYWHGDYRHGPYHHGPYKTRGEAGSLGRMDFEVQPKHAQVFIDGHFVGEARKLDGFPDHLWLRQGTYSVTLYAPGFETVTQEPAVFPKRITQINVRMVPGTAVPPPSRSETGGAQPAGDGDGVEPPLKLVSTSR